VSGATPHASGHIFRMRSSISSETDICIKKRAHCAIIVHDGTIRAATSKPMTAISVLCLMPVLSELLYKEGYSDHSVEVQANYR
jgi:hypothetical protein